MITIPEHVYKLFFNSGEVVEIRVAAGLKGEKRAFGKAGPGELMTGCSGGIPTVSGKCSRKGSCTI